MLEEPIITSDILVPDDYLDNYDGFEDDWMSTSSMSTFQKCQIMGKFKYLDRIPESIGVRRTAGSGAHKGRETNLKQKVESKEDIDVDQVKDAARDYVSVQFDSHEVHVEREFEGKSKEDAKGISVDFAVKMAENDREIFQPKIFPIAVEESLAFRYPGISRIIVGKLDDREPNNVIGDFKTGKKRFGQAKTDDAMGLTTYGMLVYATTGEIPSGYRIDNVVVTVAGNMSNGTYKTTRTKEQLQRQLDRFALWDKLINQGIFAPSNPEEWWCSQDWCGYWKICPYRSNIKK